MKLATYQRSCAALGSQICFTITANASELKAKGILDDLESRTHEFERRFSRFLPMSELNLLNVSAGNIHPISPQFRDILTQAKNASRQTNGLFNPFVLPALQRAGYLHSFVKSHDALSGVPNYTGRKDIPDIEQLEIGDDWARIPLHSALDLGGCGKGYLGDILADILDSLPSISGYWISVGGDVVARGIHESGQPIFVTIASQNGTGNIGSVGALHRIGVATSTTLKRQGGSGRKHWHHIIDPRTGLSSKSDVFAATVCHSSLMMADIHASNCIIIGSDLTDDYIIEQNISAALLEFNRDQRISHVRYGDIIVDKST